MGTLVKDWMRDDPVIVPLDCSLRDAAQLMEENNCGVLPVGSSNKIQGVITDRDIVIRAVAKGKDVIKEKVKNYMTPQCHSVQKDAQADEAANLMHAKNISRVLVEDEEGKSRGILTFGSILRKNDDMDEVATMIECAVGRKAA